MATDKVYGGSNNMNILLQHDKLPSSSSSEILNSLWIPISSSSFHGSKSMVSFENGHGGDNTTDRPYFQMLCKEEQRDEDFDGSFHQPEKKRRLTVDQVHYLESNFEVDNKLEPDRKIQLAKELGLQPRQVAIWFQNRRARYKTKQLEKDYDSLRTSYEKLEVDYECLLKEQEKLRNEVNLLKDRLALKDEEKANSEPFDSSHPSMAEPQKPIQVAGSEKSNNSAMVVCKHEDASSAKSDVFDSDIPPHYIDGDHSSLMEPANSSHVFEQDLSDHSQEDEEDNLSNSLFPPPPPLSFPKLEDGCYHDLPANSCNFGFLANDQPFWLFPY